jgi:hypothetical protein
MYVLIASSRTKGDKDALSNFMVAALHKAESITPGHVTAALYLLVATILSLVRPKDDRDNVGNMQHFSTLALQHLQYVKDSPIVRADMELKCHLTLAVFYLGCNRFGALTKNAIDSRSLEKAKISIMKIEKNSMTNYRRVQFNIVQSVFSYRCSQVRANEKVSLLKQGFDFAKTAEELASKSEFIEMLNCARACMSLCTEALIRAHFSSHVKKFS